MVTANVIKTTTRTTLKNKWGEAVFAGLQILSVFLIIVMLSSLVLSVFSGSKIVAFLLLAVAFLALTPVLLGTVRWFWALIIEIPLKLSEIYYYFSSARLFFKAVMLFVYTIGKMIIGAILSYLPAIVIYVLSKGDVLSKFGIEIGDKTMLASPIIVFFVLVGTVLFLKASLRYSLSLVIMVAKEEIEPYSAVSLSRKITQKCGFSLVVLTISYFGWIALSIFGITLIYTLPFLICSYVVTARILITNYCIDNGMTSI